MDTESDEKICPLCGADNQCAMTAGHPVERCWCANMAISAATLAAIPAGDVGRRCICPACAARGGETGDAG